MTSENPFRCSQINSLPYRFDSRLDEVSLWETLTKTKFKGAIVGPQGTGKSCLLRYVQQRCEAGGDTAIELTSPQNLRLLRTGARNTTGRTIVFVDSFEQFTLAEKLTVVLTLPRKWGLMVTAQRTIPFLPTVARTISSTELVCELVRELTLSSHNHSTPSIESLLHKENGNVREVFRSLYDHYAQRTEQDFSH